MMIYICFMQCKSTHFLFFRVIFYSFIASDGQKNDRDRDYSWCYDIIAGGSITHHLLRVRKMFPRLRRKDMKKEKA